MARTKRNSWLKYGCLGVLGLAALVAVVAGIVVGIAMRQTRTASFEHQTLVPVVETAALEETVPRVRLRLKVHTAGVSVKPLDAGESIRIEADYDPRLLVLHQRRERDGAVDVMIVELRPLGSKMMALLRAKVGGRLSMLRIAWPRDVPLEIEGDLDRGFWALELGGLDVSAASLDVRDGAAKIAFSEPLPYPMDELRIIGNRGSLSVVGLGNASPSESVFFQHLGAVDVDLRGPWSRDGNVRLIGGGAGGSVWLPDDVNVTGLGDRRGLVVTEDGELPLPTVNLSLEEHVGRFVVID
jgi:hypothetical protein